MSKEKKIALTGKVKEKVLSDADVMKIEIADELGLLDKVTHSGWKSLTSRESGRIGGLLAKRMRERAAAGKKDGENS